MWKTCFFGTSNHIVKLGKFQLNRKLGRLHHLANEMFHALQAHCRGTVPRTRNHRAGSSCPCLQCNCVGTHLTGRLKIKAQRIQGECPIWSHLKSYLHVFIYWLQAAFVARSICPGQLALSFSNPILATGINHV